MRDLSGKRDADNKAGPHPKALLAKACSSPRCARLCKPSVQELEMVVARGRFALKVCFPQHPFVGGIRASHRLCFHLHGWRSPAVKAVPGEGRRLRSRNSLELEQSTALGKPTQPCAQTVLQMPHFWTALDTCFYLYLFFFFSPSPVKSQTLEHRLFLLGISPALSFLNTTFSSTEKSFSSLERKTSLKCKSKF